MTDRVQPGALGSRTYPMEVGEAMGQFSPGWVVPASDPTLSAQRWAGIDETAFDEFDAAFGGASLDVDIAPGEAFVDGWLARDVSTTITLAASTAGQTIVLGWNPDATYDDQVHDTRDDADEVFIDLESNVQADDPYVVIWEFDTDGTGVTASTDLRHVGDPHIPYGNLDVPDVLVENPDKLPIAALEDTESIEIPVRVPNGSTLEVYRWGAYDASSGSAVTGLDVELLDDGDVVQASANTANSQDNTNPVTSYTNSSATVSVFKLRAYNGTGGPIETPGVGAHFGFRVV